MNESRRRLIAARLEDLGVRHLRFRSQYCGHWQYVLAGNLGIILNGSTDGSPRQISAVAILPHFMAKPE